MCRIIINIVAVTVAGCASTAQWRTLTLDASSENAFDESLAQMNDELSDKRRDMLELALIDIAQTGVRTAEAQSEAPGAAQTDDDAEPGYSYDDFLAQLDGLTWERIIDLADESGTPIARLYYARTWEAAYRETARQQSAGMRNRDPNAGPPPSASAYFPNR